MRAGVPRQRVFREDAADGVLRPVPIVETVRHPTAVEVVAALREFVEQSGADDLVLMRPDQARILVERVDELASTMRRLADRIAGPLDSGPTVPPAGE